MFRVSFRHHFHSLWRNERRANFNCFPNIYIDQFIILKKITKTLNHKCYFSWERKYKNIGIINVILAEKSDAKFTLKC